MLNKFYFLIFHSECGNVYDATSEGEIQSRDMQDSKTCKWLLQANKTSEFFSFVYVYVYLQSM